MSGTARAGVLFLLMPHGKEGSYDRKDLKKKELLSVFAVISLGFVQGALCYYQLAPSIPIQRLVVTPFPDNIGKHSPDNTESKMTLPSQGGERGTAEGIISLDSLFLRHM